MTALHKMVNGEKVPLSEEEIKEFRDAEALHELQMIEMEKNKHQILRQYPSWQVQMDTLYHQGYEGWHAMIKAIKDKHPKS